MVHRAAFALLVAGLTCGLGSTGCVGATAREAASAAAPAMVDGAVEGVADPVNQRKLADGIDEAAVEKIAERLSGKIVDGTMRALSDPERRTAVAETLKDVRVPVAIEGSMDIGLARIDPKAVAAAVDAAMGKALERVDDKQMRGVVHGIVDEAVRTAFSAARDEMKSAGPTEDQVASLTRSVSKEATLGFQDAVDQARRARDDGETQEGESSVLWAASRAAESGNTLLDVWKISLAVLGLALVGGLIWAVRQARAHRRELLQRDEALALLTRKVDEQPLAPRVSESESASPGPSPRPSPGPSPRPSPVPSLASGERHGPRPACPDGGPASGRPTGSAPPHFA